MTEALACVEYFDMRELLVHEACLIAGIEVGREIKRWPSAPRKKARWRKPPSKKNLARAAEALAGAFPRRSAEDFPEESHEEKPKRARRKRATKAA